MAGKSEPRPVTAYYRYQSISEFRGSRRLQGPFRVIVFCFVAILLPCILLVTPLYIRYELFKDVTYHLGESDLVTVDKPISTFWCQGQELRMNATFHAYLMDEQPQISEETHKIEMHKHMQLADDSLEYWGFFLLQGSKVTLSVCSRFGGARLMVVKGTKNLKHCALLDPSPGKDQIDPWEEDVSAQSGEKIEVTFQQGEQEMMQQEGLFQGTVAGVGNRRPLLPKPNPKPMTVSEEKVTAGPEGQGSPPLPESATRKPGNRTFRSRKPALILGPVPEKEAETTMRSPEPTADMRTLHDNVKISRPRHKTRYQAGKPNRTRRFISTMPDDEYAEEYDDAGQDYAESEHESDPELGDGEAQGEGEELDAEEADVPPNPVGVEPDQAQIDKDNVRSSGSSFAKNLWSCYGGDTLVTQTFSPSPKCQSHDAMMKSAIRMKTVHEITSTGYYYYIFYSDNDILSNDIFARFNIEKVVYIFPSYTNSSCHNVTQCALPLKFLSAEKVLLEVPLQDGVSDEDALAQMVLVSTCKPRLGVYFIFPIAILFFILACAFI